MAIAAAANTNRESARERERDSVCTGVGRSRLQSAVTVRDFGFLERWCVWKTRQ